MPDCKITDAEFSVLYGMPAFAWVLYICLRRRMDFSTGLVGAVTGLSWWALREDTHVHPVRGRHREDSGTPSEKKVRNAMASLVAAGLVDDKGSDQRLLFFLPLAAKGKARPKDEGQMKGRHQRQDEGRPQGRASARKSRHEGRHDGTPQSGDEGHTSGIRLVLSNTLPNSSPEKLGKPGDDAVDNSDLSNPPKQPDEWVMWFSRTHGTEYSMESVHDRKSIKPVLQRWIKAGVTFELMGKVVERAQELAKAPISNLIVYADRVLSTMQGEQVRMGLLWQTTDQGTLAKGKELGLEPLRGELMPAYRARISAKIESMGDGAANAA